jgi:site-specific DNA-adenine methylase
MKRIPFLKNVDFHRRDFAFTPVRPGDVVYADPPYVNTTQYGPRGGGYFDTPRFYRWAETMTELGARVFVSEYTIPEHWKIVHSFDQKANGARRDVQEFLAEVVALPHP